MEAKAVARFIRISPQKARLVADVVRGLEADKAITTLRFMPKKGAQIIRKVIESAVANAVSICGFYHVPPHKVGIHGKNSNRSNMEQENQSYVDSCLIHWLTRWEQSIAQQLLTKEERAEGLFFEFDLYGLLRGDTKARTELYKTFWNIT